MEEEIKKELPIRSKLAMGDAIIQVLAYLHSGNRVALLPLLEELKLRSMFLDEQIQEDVIAFANQVLFQYDADPWHLVTDEVQQAADHLFEDMGFTVLNEEEGDEPSL